MTAFITGDLGTVGKTILMDLLKEKGYDLTGRYTDCGLEIFDAESQDTKAGGSGCGCSAVTMCSYIMKKNEKSQLEQGAVCTDGSAFIHSQLQ